MLVYQHYMQFVRLVNTKRCFCCFLNKRNKP
nr:MAG TPA: hypothetical protein [Caudoviricetes sp.]